MGEKRVRSRNINSFAVGWVLALILGGCTQVRQPAIQATTTLDPLILATESIANPKGSIPTDPIPTVIPTQTPTPVPLPTNLIAFTSSSDGYGAVYTIRPDGSQMRRLTEDPQESWHPKWSPNGEKIAFLGGADYGTSLLYIRTFDTGEQIVVDIPGIHHFDWSADGERIAFGVEPNPPGQIIEKEYDKVNIYVFSLKDSEITHITQIDKVLSDMVWIPNTDRLIVQRLGLDLLVVDLDGNTEIIPNTEDPGFFDYSPESGWIAVDGREGQEDLSYIRIIDDQGELLQEYGIEGLSLWDPQWSPDGKMLAIRAHNFGVSTLWPHIYILDLESGETTQVTEADKTCKYSSWGPNNEFLLFLEVNLYTSQYSSLNVYSLIDGRIIRIVPKDVVGRPDWRP